MGWCQQEVLPLPPIIVSWSILTASEGDLSSAVPARLPHLTTFKLQLGQILMSCVALAPPVTADSALELPLPLPNSDPERTAALLQLLDQLSRTLNSCLLLPPTDHVHLPSVPVERILGVVLHGLGEHAPTGHTVGCRVLAAAMPILRLCMWNILSMLMRTCHAHLLPYTLHIRTLLVDEIDSKEAQQ